jgi:alginate O-acetyltransferase complex protein AlgI
VLFNSLTFVAFLGLVVGGYWVCPLSWRRGYLLGASYAFYCSWSVPFAGLLLAVSAATFAVVKRMAAAEDEAVKRRYLVLGLTLLLLPLAAFKYLSSVTGLLRLVLGHDRLTMYMADIRFVGAVGISYYTLKLLSYVVDVYWERARPCAAFSTLATYAAFFPQILSGPIQRAESLAGQLAALRPVDPDMVASGLRLMLFGFFKKLVVADRLGVLVAQIFGHPRGFSGPVLALGSYMFAVQLYADFSGITDIAIGTARLFGIESPQNFDSPFYAENIQDFWRRWHITLTTWLGDYVFTPLRMALRGWGQWGLVLSLGINMLAIGVWHGPRWTYVAFGSLHALYLIGSSLTLRARRKLWQRRVVTQWAHRLLGPLITFHLVVVSFVIFRARSLGDAGYILAHGGRGLLQVALRLGHAGAGAVLAGARQLQWNGGDAVVLAAGLVLMEIVHLLAHRRLVPQALVTLPGWVRWAGYCTFGFLILVWGEAGSTQFIYVRF